MIGAADPGTDRILLELGGILVALAVLTRVAVRFRISPIPLFLILGLAFGAGGIFPVVTAEGFIETGAEIGIILLLFMLGLEYRADELLSKMRQNASTAVVGAVLNFTPGFLVGLALGWGWLTALFLGGVTYVSSSGIAERVLAENRWKGTKEADVVVSVLVIEDLAMAVYLTVMAVLVSGRGPVVGGVSIALALVIVALVLWIAVRFGPRLSRLVFSRTDQALVLAIVGITLVGAGLAGQLQISAEVGAFLVGLMLSGMTAKHARRLLRPLRDVFSAFFFVFFGFSIDPGSIPPMLGVALGLSVATCLAMLATGWWAGSRQGLSRGARVRVGVSLIARGEFSIAIAGIAAVAGLQSGLTALTAAYVLILAVAGPLLAKLVARRSGDD